MERENFKYIISKRECEKIVEEALKTRNFQDLHYNVQQRSNVTGYLGDYFTITISVTCKGCEEKLFLFAKTLPRTIKSFLKMASSSFKKEEFVYKQYFNVFESNGFEDMLDFTAKFYLSRPNEIIIFEDLSKKGYEAADILEPAGYDQMSSLVKTLAKFHACSFVLEETETTRTGKPFRIGTEYPQYVKDFAFSDEFDTSNINQLGMDTVADYIIQKFPDIPTKFTMEEFRDKLKALKVKMFSSSMNESKRYRNVLAHGDSWPGNFLIKRDDLGKVVSSFLIDFQLIRYNPPVIDLCLAIYASTDKTLRDKYLNQVLEDYHKDLSKILGRYRLDINEVFDFVTLLECFEELKATGIGCALCYTQVMLMPKEMKNKLQADVEQSSRFYNQNRIEFFENENVWKDANYTSRIRGLIEDLYEEYAKST